MSRYLPLIIITVLLCACNPFEKHHRDDAAVIIGDKYLTFEQLDKIVPEGTDSVDSAAIVNAYIQSWAVDILTYQKARKNIPDAKMIDDMVEDYRHRLTVHFYKQELVKERVEMPTDAQASIYFHHHEQDFRLQEPVFKGIVLWLPNDIAIAPLRKLMHKPDENIEKIEKFALRNAHTYKIFFNDWLYLNNLTAITPLLNDVDRTGFFELSDSLGTAIGYISEYIPTTEIAPESLVLEQARALLLRQNQMDFLNNLDKELYLYSVKHNEIIFNSKKQ